MRFIVPYLFALVFWVLYFVLLGWPAGWPWLLALFIIWYSIVVLLLSGRRWYRYADLWLNYLIFFVSSFAVALLPNSPLGRTVYGLILGLVSGLVIYGANHYFLSPNDLRHKTVREFNQFIYLLTMWQVSIIAYFDLSFVSFRLWPWVLIVAGVAALLARDILKTRGLKKSSEPLVVAVLILTIAELFFFIELLPLHFLLSGAVITVWFFFVIDLVLAGQEVTSRKSLFKRHIALLGLIILALLLISAWS